MESEEMGESEDCSHLVMSGGEELREMTPSSSDRMEVDNEDQVDRGAERSAELSPLSDNVEEFENPLLGRVFTSSEQVLPVEDEIRAFPNPLLEGIATTTTIPPPLSPVEESCSFENPLLGRFSSASSSSQQLSSSSNSETPFHNPLLEDISSVTSAAPTTTEFTTATATNTTRNVDGDQEYDPASAPCPGFVPYDPEIIEYYTPRAPIAAPSSPPVPSREPIEAETSATTTTTTTISPSFLQRVLNLVAEELATVDFFASTAEEAIATGSAAASSSNIIDIDASPTAATVKPEQEEPDWENVHQQGEELHMRPYQRRFENRPLETRVFLLDPDNENKSLGQDEEVGREIEIKREPVSEDEEELGVDWSLAHEINRLDLEERESSEVPEEIKAQGARVTIDKGGSSISSESSSENSLLAALEEEDDEEYEEERQKRRKREDSKDAEEEEKEEEDKSSEVAPEVSSPSSDESDSSILSEGRLALKNLTADSSESDDDDWEPSASRAARLAAKPKRSLRTQTRKGCCCHTHNNHNNHNNSFSARTRAKLHPYKPHNNHFFCVSFCSHYSVFFVRSFRKNRRRKH